MHTWKSHLTLLSGSLVYYEKSSCPPGWRAILILSAAFKFYQDHTLPLNDYPWVAIFTNPVWPSDRADFERIHLSSEWRAKLGMDTSGHAELIVEK